MDIARPYDTADREACLALFDSNTPRFFDPSERADFERFLDEMRWPYQVIARDGRVVACGGHAMEADGKTVAMCWGMVEQGLHGQGLGRRLTEARLAAARAEPGATGARLNTGTLTTGFYERFGFVVERVVKDGYAPGSDQHDMTLSF